MEGVSENEEENPGGFVAVNDNDDDGDDVADRLDTQVTGGDDDLVQVTLSVTPSGLPGSDQVRVTWTGQEKVDVFKTNSKWSGGASSEIALGKTYAVSALPKQLNVEGDGASDALRDVEIKLELLHQGTVCHSDLIKVTVVEVTITSPRAGDHVTFSAASPGVCTISGSATASPGTYDPDILWTADPTAGSTLAYQDDRYGTTVTITYTALPQSNAQFGPKTVEASVAGASDQREVKVFFPKWGTNNPGGSQPNWYYYWSQTAASYGSHSYDGSLGGTGATVWDGQAWVARMGPAAPNYTSAGTWNNAQGIDLFAWMCRHEVKHSQDLNGQQWWPSCPGQRNLQTDSDSDWMRDSEEANIGQGYLVEASPTYPDQWNCGAGYSDTEHFCLSTQAQWTPYVVNTDDYEWSDTGKEHGEPY